MDPREFIVSRRTLMKMGGAALLGNATWNLVKPLNIKAASKKTPKGCARNVIFMELGGAMAMFMLVARWLRPTQSSESVAAHAPHTRSWGRWEHAAQYARVHRATDPERRVAADGVG